eukprot:TRINITY_DN29026_c0_g1_i1.p1 TRINITY_DN29026_c0_g1~~TRINITY_DN29026_c0_g1_i1.p1  ORF type:complete len:267 (+),score=47.30 TRINITY_DN29026_c0_g1_i1:216-1016(+)
MQALDRAGVDNNTLVLFTSDNGAPERPDGNHPLRGFKASTWEGGFREPGMARWPSKIQPSTVTQAIASTLDIHPTLLALAGVAPTALMDGMDLSPVLFADYAAGEAPQGHADYFFYLYAVAADAQNGLSAVRVGDYKAYYSTCGALPPAPYQPGKQNPPLLFNLVLDPAESSPVDNNGSEYHTVMQTIEAAKKAHLATITPVPNQNARGSLPVYAICGVVDSQKEHPEWPNCTLSPANWEPASICGSEACLRANPGFQKACAHVVT